MIKKKNLSKKDLATWNKYIQNPTDLVDKDNVDKKKVFKSFRFRYDLHGFSLFDANKKTEELIFFCLRKNYKEILLITGKGIHSNSDEDVYISKDLSKLKYSVPDFINSNSELSKYVSSISSANDIDGGEGAIIIKLKKIIE